MVKNADFIDILSKRATAQSASIAFSELDAMLDVQASLTYADLDLRARKIAVSLLKRSSRGARCLLLYPPGLDAVVAFFGCLYAGIIPVPVLPYASNRHLDRICRVAENAGALIGLATDTVISVLGCHLPLSNGEMLEWLQLPVLLDEGEAAEWSGCEHNPENIAFLQYTSGSTGAPRGVCVSHANLVYNAEAIASGFDVVEDGVLVSWLPAHHDMGLIGCLLQPVFSGVSTYLLSPLHFTRQPLDWLRAISRYKGNYSGASDFAYRMCIEAAAQNGLPDDLDLSCWKTAFSGAEVVRASTLKKFHEIFSPVGFKASSITACYGMAETTLWVSGARDSMAHILDVNRQALAAGNAVTSSGSGETIQLVGCGGVYGDTDLRIVNPDTLKECPPARIGEIWYSGQNVAQGYWKNSKATEEKFDFFLDGMKEKKYLRTGDMGFISNGQVYITGRLKDIIIINGKNYYPDDIENIVMESHPVMKGAACVAFSVDDEHGGERLAIIVEPHNWHLGKPEQEAATIALRSRISCEAGLRVDEVLFVRRGQVPRTSSGKLQRSAAAQRYQAGEFKEIRNKSGQSCIEKNKCSTPSLRAFVEEALRLLPGSLQTDIPLTSLGLDSLTAMRISGAIEKEFQVQIPLDLLFDGASFDDLQAHIASTDPISAPATEIVNNRFSGEEEFPLRPIQRAYVVGRDENLSFGGLSTYVYIEIDGNWHPSQLENAWNKLICRHASLRTVVLSRGAQQILESPGKYIILVNDFSELFEKEKQEALLACKQENENRVLPLGTWPLFDLKISKIERGRNRLHFGIDMLIADLSTITLLLSEMNQLLQGEELPALPEISFQTYVAYEQAAQSGRARENALRYWQDRIADIPPPPLSIASLQGQRPRLGRRKYVLSEDMWSRLVQNGARFGLTKSTIMCAIYAEVLGRWSGNAHFHLSLPLNDRLPVDLNIDRVAGDFTRIEILEIDNRNGKSFADRSFDIQKRLREDLSHRMVDGVDVLQLMSRVAPETTEYGRVVFTSGIGLPDFISDPDFWILGEEAGGISQTPQVVLDNHVFERHGGLVVNWDAMENAFPDGFLDSMFEAYIALITDLADSPKTWFKTSPLLLTRGQRLTRDHVNATETVLPHGHLDDPFGRRALLTPDAPALLGQGGDTELSYSELRQLADGIAQTLGQPPLSGLTGVAIGKCFAGLAAIIGVLLSGSGYIPIDPDLPLLRRKQILVKSGISRVVVSEKNVDDPAWSGLEKIIVGADGMVMGTTSADNMVEEKKSGFEDLAYVIFTSGSTGEPKGVALNHRGPLNTIMDLIRCYDINENDRFLALSNLNFDLSVFDIFAPLSSGGALVLPTVEQLRNPEQLLQLMADTGVTIWNSVPALMDTLIDHIENTPESIPNLKLRLVMLSGDWIPPALPAKISAIWPGIQVLSLGGATEASIWSISHPVVDNEEGWTSVPYGTPMGNQTFNVMNDRQEDCPDWVEGEICIGGMGLAQGYLHDPVRTAEHFITDTRSGKRFYRTGDLGRYRPNGVIEFLGRRDDQIKINGYRIELGEIEKILLSHDRVSKAVVLRHGDRYAGRLVAYVVLSENDCLALAELKEMSRIALPHYMVPERIVMLEALPLTANGKIDRKALKEKEISCRDSDVGNVSNDTIKKLRKIVSDVMEISEVPSHASAFDLGATSMHLIRIRRRIESEFGCKIGLANLFQNPTVESLSEYLHENSEKV
ncbi:non-ribosomal peptide synthetase [Acetobacter sp.]|uniref:non-ribosomal peptide synthetase n=1 Tax=Acetobacter sp. TaxID=440 RepID=UPI0025C024D8|nr:non-ribosomal peptide synthetase [Acetobacter sp.]MCH4092494.1 amino acid adenylation domain-containing protein [Acetobacter sp.]MCI1299628.1 amino acid adenylation domain-containing protein [Acetobacter sp.]MCI1315492.1 amino acid adenylation domain-containing protein [Acetobacter sp.]